jgi:hypothetical protein
MTRTRRTCTNAYRSSPKIHLAPKILMYWRSIDQIVYYQCLLQINLCNIGFTVCFVPLQLCILVLGALGGRFDHEMGNINVLYHFSSIKIILLSDDSSIFLLPKTHSHEIHVDPSIEGPHCGLIPMGAPSSSSTTTGLRWNLGTSIYLATYFLYDHIPQISDSLCWISTTDNTSMSYGGLVSTSNIVEEEKVTVTSDSDLIWTISLRNHA